MCFKMLINVIVGRNSNFVKNIPMTVINSHGVGDEGICVVPVP